MKKKRNNSLNIFDFAIILAVCLIIIYISIFLKQPMVPEIPITVCFKAVDANNLTTLSGYDAYLRDSYFKDILDVRKNVSGEVCFDVINGHQYLFDFYKDGYFPVSLSENFLFNIPNYTSSCEAVNGKISCKYYNQSLVYHLGLIKLERIKLDLKIKQVNQSFTEDQKEVFSLALLADTNADGALTITFEPFDIVKKSRIEVKGDGCGIDAGYVITCPVSGETEMKIKLTKDYDQEITMIATLNVNVRGYAKTQSLSKTLKYVFEPLVVIVPLVEKGDCDTEHGYKIVKVVIDGKEFEVCQPPEDVKEIRYEIEI